MNEKEYAEYIEENPLLINSTGNNTFYIYFAKDFIRLGKRATTLGVIFDMMGRLALDNTNEKAKNINSVSLGNVTRGLVEKFVKDLPSSPPYIYIGSVGSQIFMKETTIIYSNKEETMSDLRSISLLIELVENRPLILELSDFQFQGEGEEKEYEVYFKDSFGEPFAHISASSNLQQPSFIFSDNFPKNYNKEELNQFILIIVSLLNNYLEENQSSPPPKEILIYSDGQDLKLKQIIE